MDFTLLPTAETDRTYLARLNFLTDVFGQEDKEVSPGFDEDYDYYVR
ncbi:MAG: GNAT family N-acetyltransferase, partial [Corynebacterium flavescens]|nr:GNAT family N-acetyltransferase [Corynebacterium flavescens]